VEVEENGAVRVWDGKERDWSLPKIGGRMFSYVMFVQSLSYDNMKDEILIEMTMQKE